MRIKVVLLVILSVILTSFFVFYSLFFKEQYGIKDIPDKYYEIKIHHIQDSTKLFENSKFLFKTFYQFGEIINYKLDKDIFSTNSQGYSLDFAFHRVSEMDKFFNKFSISIPGLIKGKIIVKEIQGKEKSCIILWNNLDNVFFDSRMKKYYTITDTYDDRDFPWEIGSLTFCVYSNLDTILIRKLYPNFNGPVFKISLDSIIINWNKYNSLRDYSLLQNDFVKLINLRNK
jgi:hypothetical protein